ncbi:MAG: hypothetical protein ABIW76_14360, partial [Fibrobacteria bacterium]
MADIIMLLREESSQSALENGVSGVGGLQTREFGYSSAADEFSFKAVAGFKHLTTKEKMALSAAAATSGAKGVGIFPPGALAATNVQDIIDEMLALIAAGGGGTVLGTGTTGKLTKWANSTTITDSLLSEASGKILFSGDAVANLYRGGAGSLFTDGSFAAVNLFATGNIYSTNGVSADSILAALGIQSEGYLATPMLKTAAATLTLSGAHNTVVCSHATPVITLPLASSLPPGTEFWIYFHGNSGSVQMSGSDVWMGTTADGGLGVEGMHVTLTPITTGIFVKSDGVDTWAFR